MCLCVSYEEYCALTLAIKPCPPLFVASQPQEGEEGSAEGSVSVAQQRLVEGMRLSPFLLPLLLSSASPFTSPWAARTTTTRLFSVGKHVPRVYVSFDPSSTSQVCLSREQSHHMKNVLRLRSASRVNVFNELGEWDGNISELSKTGGTVKLNKKVGYSSTDFFLHPPLIPSPSHPLNPSTD